MKLKVLTEHPNADRALIGKPVCMGKKVVGKVVDVQNDTIVSEIEDEFYTKLFESMPTSMGVKD